jgi:hypothetical protein
MITFSSIGYNGRLANQIFQFASTIGIARKLGYDPIFPIENFISGDPHDYNGGKLRECFDIPGDYFLSRDEINRATSYTYNEGSFKYDEATKGIPDGVDLRGYFQSELYFKDYSDEIRKVLKFRGNVLSESDSFCKVSENSTCIHVRRGDYVTSPNHHPVQTVEYYKKAIDLIGDSTFYVFSDDLEWCRENLGPIKENMIFIDVRNPYVSLCLMTKCRNHIIANSSLSWWAAWLGKKEGQIVFSPLNWFGPALSNNDTSDLYCPGWNKI